MSAKFLSRLQHLSLEDNSPCLQNILHGLEKEGLRITDDLYLSQQPHPKALGSSLTHPYITTDYSEALLEFVTPVYRNSTDAIDMLAELHSEALKKMPAGEFIWGASMPAILQGDDYIPVATFGSSNIGQMKHVYRQGLSHRYGKSMQTIAGIHYNFSLPARFWEIIRAADLAQDSQQALADDQTLSAQDYQSNSYFALIRNFRRYAWLLSYLFGASPAVDVTFLKGNNKHGLERLDEETWYLPWATSLRMSDLGYTSDAQASLNICYNSVDEYIVSLWNAIHTPYPAYEKIGVKDANGQYRQLNDSLLQIENEYYSTIRPKRVVNSGEKPVVALKERGVEYVEVRSLDVNPLLPLGIDDVQARLMDIFLLFCALQDSPNIDADECEAICHNFDLSVREGRRPGLELIDGSKARKLDEWGLAIFEQLLPIAALLDKVSDTVLYQETLSHEQKKLTNVKLTPSFMILDQLQTGKSFRQFVAEQSKRHCAILKNQQPSEERQVYFDRLAEQSLLDQALKESSDMVDFSTYLQNYFNAQEIVV